jgi:hypothetical protein
MGQKGIVFSTRLTVKDCADVFRRSADVARGVRARMFEVGARLAGNGDRLGFYTPTFDSPFAGIDGTPDFAVGVNILKFSAGAQGNGTHVHMYVDDSGNSRSVQVVSRHGVLDGGRSGGWYASFSASFRPRIRT